MTSGSRATVRTFTDYSGSKVRSFSSRCGRHDTLLLLTVIKKLLVECIIEPAMSEALRACPTLMEQSKENAEIGKIFTGILSQSIWNMRLNNVADDFYVYIMCCIEQMRCCIMYQHRTYKSYVFYEVYMSRWNESCVMIIIKCYRVPICIHQNRH